ncbi:MAG: VCBS repeat-containing protein [Verrucomicrobia bacterium]|nr:VCBS repeat-containing protein [Verrucomicrobiota bacterium]
MLRSLAQSACLLLLAFCLAGCKRSPSGSSDQAAAAPNNPSDQFLSLMNAGKNYLDQGDATNALAIYKKAQAIVPNDADLHLNLANCYLLSGSAEETIREADEVLKLEPNSAAAYFVKGSAYLRLSNPEEAVKALENAKRIEPGDTATSFQLGLARMGLKQWDAAITAFKEGIKMDPNHLHSAAHYLLAQALLRAGRDAEAQQELLQHQANLGGGGPAVGAATFERSKYTQARVPFKLEQPGQEGIKITFVDATREALGDGAQNFSGPIGVIDANHTGWNSLFVVENGLGFRLLWNTNGTFHPYGATHPAIPSANYSKMLVGDLQNDRFDDIVVLGDKGSHLFKFATNGLATDVSTMSRLSAVSAIDGTLIDLDFTGKLDLIAVTASTNDVRVYRQFGPLLFSDITSTSGIPASLHNVQAVMMDDWNRDQIMDVIAGRKEGPPLLLEKQRGGRLVPREQTNWVAGAVFSTGDFDNDLRADLAVAGDGKITICFNGGERKEIDAPGQAASRRSPPHPVPLPLRGGEGARRAGEGPVQSSDASPELGVQGRRLVSVDYDNDGWLDLWEVGEKIRVWRNLGLSGFQERTAQLGLDQFDGGAVSEIHFADFDRDCDSDAIIALANGGLRYLRNEGGNANSQVKVQLFGNRSNASGIGCKVEIETGGLRLIRTVQRLPVEVGVGKYQKLDSFLVHWFNWPQGAVEVPVDCKEPLLALELTIQEGSCPYLYAWDGTRFRFVTDILGAAPLGLPIAEGRYIEADPEEFVWIGNEQTFPARDGNHEVQITEELREVLYLDEAKLVVVDHEPGTEVHPTDKLLPSKPFPLGTLLTLHNEHPLQRAEIRDGGTRNSPPHVVPASAGSAFDTRPPEGGTTDSMQEVTAVLRTVDGQRVSPPKLRVPQLRGLAEPHGLILDFGPLDTSKPLVLVMNGWLRFGGGMANIAASHDPSLPFPFPKLEAEVAPGTWKTVDVVVGAPAGKSKTILVDLEGKLAPGTRRLRLTDAFEIHWDRIALMEKQRDALTKITFISPAEADLHFRGSSALEDLPPDWPLTPDYDKVSPNSYWTITPGGWCTRYGDVSELIASRDEALALLNSGDELTLRFSVNSLPPKPAGSVREFFLYLDGWDKDSDFHVAAGTQVEPLPFHGMNDQLYGREKRPRFPSDALNRKYNTRWVEGRVLRQSAKR